MNLEVGQQFGVCQGTVGLCGNGFMEMRRAGVEKIKGQSHGLAVPMLELGTWADVWALCVEAMPEGRTQVSTMLGE